MTLVISVHHKAHQCQSKFCRDQGEGTFNPSLNRWLSQVKIEVQFATHALLINNPTYQSRTFH